MKYNLFNIFVDELMRGKLTHEFCDEHCKLEGYEAYGFYSLLVDRYDGYPADAQDVMVDAETFGENFTVLLERKFMVEDKLVEENTDNLYMSRADLMEAGIKVYK